MDMLLLSKSRQTSSVLSGKLWCFFFEKLWLLEIMRDLELIFEFEYNHRVLEESSIANLNDVVFPRRLDEVPKL